MEEVVTLGPLNDLVRRVADLDAQRVEVKRDPARYLGKLSEELREVTAAYLKSLGQGRGSGAPGDLVGELADLCGLAEE